MQENKFVPLSQPEEDIREEETQKSVSPNKGTPSDSPKEAENPKGMALEDEEDE